MNEPHQDIIRVIKGSIFKTLVVLLKINFLVISCSMITVLSKKIWVTLFYSVADLNLKLIIDMLS